MYRRTFLGHVGAAGAALFILYRRTAEAVMPPFAFWKAGQPPVWVSPAAGSLGSYKLGDTVNQTMVATDPGGHTPVTFSKVSGSYPGGVSLDSSSGVLSGLLGGDNGPVWNSPAAGSLGAYELGNAISQTLSVTPQGSATIQNFSIVSGFIPHGTTLSFTAGNSSATLSGTLPNTYFPLLTYINDAVAPVWSTTAGSLGEYYENVTISTINVSATAQGSATISWYQVVSGYLPTGLTLDSTTGNIDGTPLVVTYPNDPIVDVIPKPTWNSPAAGLLETVKVGTAATTQTLSASPNSPATSIVKYHVVDSSGTLPPGLVLDPINGTISGTPANVLNDDTTFNFTIRAIDNCDGYQDRAYSYTVQTTDPYWANVVLALRMNGTDLSTTFTDEVGKTVTTNGSAQISATQYRVGGASGSFNGTNSYLTLADSSDWDLSGDFTIECWVRPTNFTQSSSQNQTLISAGNASTDWELHVNTSGSVILSCNNRATTVLTATVALAATTWKHVAFSRSGSTVYAFVNGAAAGTATSSTSFTATALTIARMQSSSAGYFNGYLDDLRITKGVARYTAAFSTYGIQNPNKT